MSERKSQRDKDHAELNGMAPCRTCAAEADATTISRCASALR